MNVPIDITGVTLHTARMTLRPWQESDAEDFYAYASVDGVGQMAGWTPHKSIEESRSILEKFIAHKKTFALIYQGKVIGSIGIEEYEEEKIPQLAELSCREIGYVLAREYWGMGLMPEAVSAVIQWLFAECNLDAIICCHFIWNHQSARVQEKCGFHYFASGVYETGYGSIERDVMNILYREEWVVRYYEADCTPEIIGELREMSADWASENSCRGYYPNQPGDIEGNRIFLAQRGDRVIGYLLGKLTRAENTSSVMKQNTPYFEVEELYVRPYCRSQGIGAALYQFAESCVRAEADYITLTTATKDWKKILHFYLEELGMEFRSARLFQKIEK